MKQNKIYVPKGRTTLGVPLILKDNLARQMSKAVAQTTNHSDYEYFLDFLAHIGHQVVHVPAFYIDKSLVTGEQLEAFRAITNITRHWCRACLGPVQTDAEGYATSVSWMEAVAFSIFQGGRLPTISEMFRIIRKGNECPDLLYDSHYHEHRQLVDENLEEDRTWCGCLCALTGPDEWTGTPHMLRIKVALWDVMSDYICVRKRPRDIFPLVPESGDHLLDLSSGSSMSLRCKHGRTVPITYSDTGFRCVYPA